jgi:ArsR family transcriptional regulator, arsenate/arsenite/antimonite-responsive transcriptional repressor
MARKLDLITNCCPPLAGTLSDAAAAELEQVFRALGDRHRVKILNLLSAAGGEAICVCDLVPALGLAQPTVSYHLKQLVNAGVIEREKRGTFSHYRLVPTAFERVRELLAAPAQATAALSA